MTQPRCEDRSRLKIGSLARGLANTGFLFSGNAIAALISFVITVYIARTLSISDFGSYITVISFVSLFGIFTDFGINTVIIREGAKKPEETSKLISGSMGLKFLMSVVTMFAVIVFVLLTPYAPEIKVLIGLMSVTLIMGGIGSLFSAVFCIYQDMQYIAVVQIAERITFATLAFVFLIVGLGVPGVILAIVIAAFASLVLNFLNSRRIRYYKLNFRPTFNRAILAPAVWFGLAGVLGLVWQQIGTIMISLLSNLTQVGLYTPAINYIGIGDMAVVALTGAFFPIICRATHEERISKKVYSKYVGYFALAGLAAVAVTYAIGGQVTIFVFGPKFAQSIAFINVLIIGYAINLLTIPTSLLLDATDNQKVHVLNASYMSAVNIGLNSILIPTIGALGAAYSTTVAQSLGAVLGIPIALYFLKRSHVF